MFKEAHYKSFSDLVSSLRLFKVGVSIMLLLQVVVLFIELLIPFITRALVDQGINNQDIDFIYLVGLSLFALSMGSILIHVFKQWIMKHIGVRMTINLLNAFMTRLLQKSILFFAKHSSGEIIQLVNDNLRIERFFTSSVAFLLELSLKLIAFGIVLFLFDPTIALVYFVSIALGFGWDMLFLSKREEQDKRKFAGSSAVRGDIVEVVQGINDIKVNKLERDRLNRWDGIQHFLARTSLKLMAIHHQNNTGTLVINQVRDVFIILFAAISVVEGRMTLGSMLAVQYIIGELNRKTSTLVQFVAELQEAKLSFDRLKKIMEAPDVQPFIDNGIDYLPAQANIRTDDLVFAYDQQPVLHNINLEIPHDANVAIVGESGSGKSTLVKLILRLLSPTKGQIYIGDYRLGLINTDVWRDSCSILMQESVLFSATLRYNITLKLDDVKVDPLFLDRVIKMCALQGIVNDLPDGLGTKVGTGGKALSKGQTQRVLLARTVFQNAPYLIMDEPTSALDAVTAFEVFENIKAFYEDRTIILITHKINIARQMDLIFVMDNGRIVERGTHDELMANQGKYYQLATIK
jgi:ATP-binding cassette subfamily B protein